MPSYCHYSVLSFSALVAVVARIAIASDITTYTDGKCAKSFRNLDVVNGYPDGVCTPLNIAGSVNSFQIADLDQGCAVTLYGENEGSLTCSSSLKIVGEFATCYNSSWVYYSIDGCLPPSSSSIILPTATPTPLRSTSSSSIASSSSSSSSTTSPLASSASASTTPTPSPNSSRLGVIIGGTLGGVAIFALIFAVALLYLRRRNRHYTKPLPTPPTYELSNEHARWEASSAGIRYPEKMATIEMWGHDAAAEIGRNSVYEPPVELPGDSIAGNDKKGMSSLVRFHRNT